MRRMFRSYLRSELLRRCRANPRYSLRAFARTLDYDPSSLSKILQGRRPLGPRTIERFGSALGLDEKAVRQFIYDERVSKVQGYLPTSPDNAYHQLSLDTFQVISDWYHYAILELIHVKGFRPSVRWIANTLCLRSNEVEAAIARLKKVGLLKVTEKGRFIEVRGDRLTTVGTPGSTAAFRNMQRQLLLKALHAMEATPIDERDQSSMTMAIDSRKLPQAKEKIRRFRRELCGFLTRVNERDAVYALTVALFPLSHRKAGK
jgi:uncharacterized protein (TIGR02147 family)